MKSLLLEAFMLMLFPLSLPSWAERSRDLQIMTIAAVIFAEAQGEPLYGKECVTSTIVNRQRKVEGGKAVVIVLDHAQYATPQLPERRADSPTLDMWAQCHNLSRQVVDGTFTPCIEATHFYAPKRVKEVPYWVADMDFEIEVAGHRFYKPRKGRKE